MGSEDNGDMSTVEETESKTEKEAEVKQKEKLQLVRKKHREDSKIIHKLQEKNST